MSARRATVPSDDRGLLLGDGLFETVRLFSGIPFRLESHLARLEKSAALVGIPIPAGLRAKVAAGVRSARGRNAALRITLTRGSGPGLAPPRRPRSRLVITVRGVGGSSRARKTGLSALLRGRVDERSLVATLKAIGYLERIQALRLARAEGADEALLCNSEGRVVEGSSSNFFALRGGTLLAPGPDQGALPGITRGVLLEVAERLGLPVEERAPKPEDLAEASEVVLSSALRGIVPVVQIEGRRVGDGVPGPVFLAFLAGYRDVVRRETGGSRGGEAGLFR